MMSSTSSWR